MKPLSPNNATLRITLPVIITALGVFFNILLLKNYVLWLLLVVFSIVGFSMFYVLRKYNQTANVFYDIDYLYLKYPHQTQKIKLQDIKHIQLTLSSQKILGTQYYCYKINFKNESDLHESISIWISPIHNYVTAFEKYLDYYAPNVQIKHSVSSFDS